MRNTCVTLSLIAALAPLSVACSGTSDANPEQDLAKTDQALSPSVAAVAFQSVNGSLYESGPDYTGQTRGWIAPTTSPSIAEMDGGFYRDVFQGADANHNLWLNGPEGPHSLNIPMAPNTSPCIAGIDGGGYQILFQGSDGNLWMTGTWGTGDTGWPMKGGTSPSISMLPGSTWEGAFQGQNGNLWVVGQVANGDTGIPMAPNAANPAIAGIIGGGYQILFQGSDGNLWMTGTWGTGDTGWPMKTGTSPSITMLPGSTWQGAFQGQNGNLWFVGQIENRDTGLPMMANTSPSIAGLARGGYEIAYQDYNGHYHLTGTDVTGDTGGLMRAGTSPSIAPVYRGPSIYGYSGTSYDGNNAYAGFGWKDVPGASKYRVFVDGKLFKETTQPGSGYVTQLFSTKVSGQVFACFPNGFCVPSNQASATTPKNPNTPPPVPTTGSISVYYELAAPQQYAPCGVATFVLDDVLSESMAGYWIQTSDTHNKRPYLAAGYCQYNWGFTLVKPGVHSSVCAYVGDPNTKSCVYNVSVVAGSPIDEPING